MAHESSIWVHLAHLLSYPERAKLAHLFQLQTKVRPEQRCHLAPLVAFVKESRLADVEELFTRSFDLNPTCCLEIGWHLYGEDYERGRFLVHMRQSLREHGIPETVELPDHLSHVLQLLDRLPDEEAAPFSRRYIQPALTKIREHLAETNPYRGLLALLAEELETHFGAAEAQAALRPQRVIDTKLKVLNGSR